MAVGQRNKNNPKTIANDLCSTNYSLYICMMKKYLSFLLVLCCLASCQQRNGNFPEVKDLKAYKETDFLPTLEHAIPAGKNAIYAASLPYAWNEVRKAVKAPIAIDAKFADLTLLHATKSYLNVLKQDEYSTSVSVTDDEIQAKAYFQKMLPFEYKFDTFKGKLTFDNKKVASFGLHASEHKLYYKCDVLYYEDDNNFLFSLTPKDEQHEILLGMFGGKQASIAQYLQKIKEWQAQALVMQQDEKKRWRFYLDRALDKVIIPKLTFNIETNFEKIIGNNFHAGQVLYRVTKVYQSTAFILDESGAKVESEAEMEAKKEGEMMEEKPVEKPRPKNLVFDKPFLLMLKRKDNPNPYFAMWVNNAELMVLEK